MKGLKINELSVGQTASFSKTITESDVYLFAGVTGDINPAHLNEDYAKNTFFKGRIAHGMLSAGLISAVIGVQLPGPGAIYASQTLKFLAPVRFGDTITAAVEIQEIYPEKNRVVLKTYCTNQNDVMVTSGEAVVLPQK
ncbi:MaoC family dehydratase [Clostridium sp. PL3]|uniref:MaoC family dehydratase n=1 Tax=Clostridium thailandense TaxID=2794346 RepID=A0A949WY60_9CLOT|nr:MaoC family dehydratase [Clostridium thailandense]MBV7276742.1 MaoC family dehydratase [Clostridium thailandense]